MFLGMMASLQTVLRSELAALWAYAYLNDALSSQALLSERSPSSPQPFCFSLSVSYPSFAGCRGHRIVSCWVHGSEATNFTLSERCFCSLHEGYFINTQYDEGSRPLEGYGGEMPIRLLMLMDKHDVG